MKTFGFDQYVVELSDWDAAHPENYAGTPEDWKRSTAALKTTLDAAERSVQAHGG